MVLNSKVSLLMRVRRCKEYYVWLIGMYGLVSFKGLLLRSDTNVNAR